MEEKVSFEKVCQIVEELRASHVLYCESVGSFKWRKRGWPEDPKAFHLIDAMLRVYREMDCTDAPLDGKLTLVAA